MSRTREEAELAAAVREVHELEADLGELYDELELESLAELLYENHKARTIATEEAMRAHLRRKGWSVVDLPGRGWNSPGPDAVAFRPNGSLLLLDNKAFLSKSAAGKPVRSASGLSAPSLAANLPALIAQLGAAGTTPAPVLDQLRRTHAAAQAAAAGSSPLVLPKKVQRVVTNAGGLSSGVDDRLRRAGMRFIDLARRMGLSASALGVR